MKTKRTFDEIFDVTDAKRLATDLNPFSDDLLDWFDTFEKDKEPIPFEDFIKNKAKQ